MTGWLVAIVVWALGIYPTHQGIKALAKSEDIDVENVDKTDKAFFWACAILWPIFELIELFHKDDDNDNKE